VGAFVSRTSALPGIAVFGSARSRSLRAMSVPPAAAT